MHGSLHGQLINLTVTASAFAVVTLSSDTNLTLLFLPLCSLVLQKPKERKRKIRGSSCPATAIKSGTADK